MPQRQARWRDPLRGERVEFPGRRGNLLVGDLHRRGDDCSRALVLCHGMESSRGGTKQTAIVERFVPKGYTVLRFDFSFVGESDGRFEDLTVSGEVDDALGALDFLAEFAPSSCILVGSSLGGAVALLAARHAAETVHGVATIAAVADTRLFTATLTPREIEEWHRSGRRRWRDSFLKATFVEDLEKIDIEAAVRSLDVPLLVMHGQADRVVPCEHAHRIARAAKTAVELRTFPGIGHRFSEPSELDALLDTLEEWLGRVHKEAGRA